MGDFETLLQDFSYLKSLEKKNQTPRKLSKKLLLADPSVQYVVKKVFEKTKEATFDRIFHRPIGQRCFQTFVDSPEYAATNPCAKLALNFITATKALISQSPSNALETLDRMKSTYICSQAFLDQDLCQNASLLADLDSKRQSINSKILHASVHNVNVKDIFQPFVQPCKDFLSGEPWTAFQKSPMFVRYCQWKHLELNNKITLEDFDVLRILGRGGFGEVYGCRKHDTGAVFAMKCLDKRRLKVKHQEASAVHERNVLAEMHSKFVTNLKYAFHNDETLFLVLDLMEGGDLSYHLKKKTKFNETEARFYAAEMCMGLAHIHSRQMIYRDLKPANVLLDGQGHARISDLGLVRDIRKSLPTSECGTHGYMAPEVLKSGATYDTSADWWSLGCVIYHMLVGYSPFRGPSKKISKAEVDRRTLEIVVDYPAWISTEAKDIISQLLDRNPKNRLGCRGRGVSELRNHVWFASIDWQALSDLQLDPPIRPSSTQVNAKDVFEIERFDDADTKRVVVTTADNDKYYKHFYHVMSHQWQEEILESVFDQITAQADAAESKRGSKSSQSVASDPPIMQGFLLKHGGFLHRSWQRRYVELYRNRVIWRDDPTQASKHEVLLSEVSKLEEVIVKSQKSIHIITERKTFALRAEYDSDHDIWLEQLQATFGANPIVGAKLLDSRVSSSSVNVAFDDDDQGQDLRRVITQRSEDTLSATPAPRPSQQEQQRKPSKSGDDDSVAATSSGGEAAEEE